MARRRRSRTSPAAQFVVNGESLTFREAALRAFEPHRLEHENKKLDMMRENLAETEAAIASFKTAISEQENLISDLENNSDDADKPEETAVSE